MEKTIINDITRYVIAAISIAACIFIVAFICVGLNWLTVTSGLPVYLVACIIGYVYMVWSIGKRRKITHEEICKSYNISNIDEFSDGCHTFDELYYYRMLYNAAFFNCLPKELVHKSKKHNDGEECFGGGWFIVMVNLPTGQISNHYELKYWDLFQIPEKEIADKWDGHTPQQAAERLHQYLLNGKNFRNIYGWS